MKRAKKYLTFSTKGLNKIEVDFLADIEKHWLKGEQINRDLMYKIAVKHKGTPQAKGIIEAFEYWEFMPKPVIRESLKKPVKLSELLTADGSIYLSDSKTFENWRVKETERLQNLQTGMIDLPYYFELINGRLYAKYETIIGSRFIALVKNDLPKPKK